MSGAGGRAAGDGDPGGGPTGHSDRGSIGGLGEPAARRLTFGDRLRLGLALFLFGWLLRLLTATYRIRVVEGGEHLDRLAENGGPAVLVGWHEAILAGGSHLLRELLRGRLRFTLLVSSSRDGEAMARIAARFDIPVVRGSTSRGALQGLRRLYRSLKRDRAIVALAPDGPRGPARVCQPGALLLAQLGEAPLVPLACAADRFWRLRSWDRMLVPKPFARIAVAVGAPLQVAPALGSTELRDEAEALGRTLDDLAERAGRALASPGHGGRIR